MEKITVYHNNRCSKSRCALSILEEKGIEPEIRYYLKDAPTVMELQELLKKLNIPAEELVRKNEKIYKEKYKGNAYSEEEWVQILSENPRLIERPVIIRGNRAIVGRPPELVEEFLKNE